MDFSEQLNVKAHTVRIWKSVERRLAAAFKSLASDSAGIQKFQRVVIAVLTVWSVINFSYLILIPWRSDTLEAVPDSILNPPTLQQQTNLVVVDVSSVIGSKIFGGMPVYFPKPQLEYTPENRNGIEREAKESRLDLMLTGIASSTENGLGSAVIKAKNIERVYSVGDLLPASGRVILAKIMPEQIVIDNNGAYELIKLYVDLDMAELVYRPQKKNPSIDGVFPTDPISNARVSQPQSEEKAMLARLYRERLYEDPESLAEVVSVTPVREENSIIGYRVSSGIDRRAFEAFGFQDGDIVTAVNGLELRDTSNAVKLYQIMKDAKDATFDINRDGGTVLVNVNLSNP